MNAVTLPKRPPEAGSGLGGEPDLWVVEPQRRRNTLWFALLIAAVCAAAIFLTVAINALGAADALPIAELEQQVAEAERHHRALVAEVAALEDPSRVADVAAEELGLVPAEVTRHLVLEGPAPDRSQPTGRGPVAAGVVDLLPLESLVESMGAR
jgi:cell division protein FtsL